MSLTMTKAALCVLLKGRQGDLIARASFPPPQLISPAHPPNQRPASHKLTQGQHLNATKHTQKNHHTRSLSGAKSRVNRCAFAINLLPPSSGFSRSRSADPPFGHFQSSFIRLFISFFFTLSDF